MTLPGNNLQSQITDYVLLPMLSQTLCRKAVPEGVDFVARGGSEPVYIQVSDDVSADSTLERELASLLSIRDAFPKALIARTRHRPYTREGVFVESICWLQ